MRVGNDRILSGLSRGDGASLYSGGLAQLGEHLLCKQGVVGSIPSSSTNRKCEVSVSSQACRVVYPAGLTPYGSVLFNKLEEGCIAEVPEDGGAAIRL